MRLECANMLDSKPPAPAFWAGACHRIENSDPTPNFGSEDCNGPALQNSPASPTRQSQSGCYTCTPSSHYKCAFFPSNPPGSENSFPHRRCPLLTSCL